MALKMGMHRILLASGTEKGIQTYRTLLKDACFCEIDTARSGGEARQKIALRAYDLVLINTPLPDEFGHDLSIHVIAQGLGVLLLVQQEHYSRICAHVVREGVITVRKPVPAPLLSQMVHVALAIQKRMERYERENEKLQTRINELRVVSRAKCILMDYLGMSEEQAHRYIEKQAMDRRETKLKISEGILKTYEG